MLSLKNEGNRARIGGLKPEILFAVMAANEIYALAGGYDCVITSGTEPGPNRVKGSKHLVGYAVDLRTRDLDNKDEVYNDLVDALGPDYDVILESNHLHIEFDPQPLEAV